MTTQVLDHAECMRLLASQQVGRLAVVSGHHPMVVPVNFALDQGVIVFRTGEGTKLDAAQHRNVAFQVDQIDVVRRSGWSVLVTGMAEVVSDRHSASVVDRTEALPIEPFEDDDKPTWVRIIPDRVTGRRIGPEHLPDPRQGRGYL